LHFLIPTPELLYHLWLLICLAADSKFYNNILPYSKILGIQIHLQFHGRGWQPATHLVVVPPSTPRSDASIIEAWNTQIPNRNARTAGIMTNTSIPLLIM
jgi:hypothetical protein